MCTGPAFRPQISPVHPEDMLQQGSTVLSGPARFRPKSQAGSLKTQMRTLPSFACSFSLYKMCLSCEIQTPDGSVDILVIPFTFFRTVIPSPVARDLP